MKKAKRKKKIITTDLPDVPACFRFCDPTYLGENYEWQSWGLVIRHLRDCAGMDQEVFGRLLKGYNRGQVSRYETEQSDPPIDFWVKLMRTFGLNVSWAITGIGKPYITEFSDCEERKRFYKWAELIDEKENFLKELKGW